MLDNYRSNANIVNFANGCASGIKERFKNNDVVAISKNNGDISVVKLESDNIINPVASLLNEKVYKIPCLFIVGWRGEPGYKDEPQHVFQGETTVKLLEDVGIKTAILTKNTTEEESKTMICEFEKELKLGNQVALVVSKGTFEYKGKTKNSNNYALNREEIIEHIVKVSGDDVIVSTTGKASRELFEIRENLGQLHEYDFLTVGSMGHSSSIALSIAKIKQDKKVWCIDGNGAVLMHMGAMGVLGQSKQKNIVHILINNEAHETVGGMPTVSKGMNWGMIAQGCGYENYYMAQTEEELVSVLNQVKNENKLCFVEVKCSIGARDDLGRPTTTARENKETFMKFLAK